MHPGPAWQRGSGADPVVLRPARADDGGAVAEVWLRSFAAALPTVRLAHPDDEVRRWVREELVVRAGTWVAGTGDGIIGVMALSPGWIDTLYLDPDARGRGIGDRFIALAKEQEPSGLQLWTFQVNGPAQRFYERHGFVAVERTDGAGNQEREPDVRYRWP